MEENKTLEEISFSLIANAGDVRSLAFQALQEAKNKNFEKSQELLEQSKKSALAAHKMQTQLLTGEANGNSYEVNVLLVHAQDHLMTSMLAEELIKGMIDIRKEMEELKK